MSNQIADIQRILSTEDKSFASGSTAPRVRVAPRRLTTKNEVSIDEELENVEKRNSS
jgi:hypothetical protein